jgi:mono/diheme cytochrome c family protein
MKPSLVKKVLLGAALLAGLAWVVVYTWSTAILDKAYQVPVTAVHLPVDSVSVMEGSRLTRIEHCHDCHGERLTGGVVADVPHKFEFVGPDLTQIVPTYTDGELYRLLNYGVEKNGHSVYIMPSYMFHQLKPESVLRIIAYLRTLKPQPPTPGIPVRSTYAFLGRLKLIESGTHIQIACQVGPDTPRLYIPRDTTEVSHGKYLAMTICVSCHGRSLKGSSGEGAPDLIAATAYKESQFRTLLRTGLTLGGTKDMEGMGRIANNSLKYLTDKEISAIYAYLQTKPTLKSPR